MAEERDATGVNVTKRFFAQGEQIAGARYYYTRDHLGSIREMTNSTGAIQARYDYDPYGRATLVQGTNLADFQYAGYYEHQTSGLNFTKDRAYDPNTAKWLSRDPIGEDGGINLYDYVGNNPANYSDPLGLLNPNGQWPLYSKQTFDDAVSQLSKSIQKDDPSTPPAVADAAALEIMTEMTLFEGQDLNSLTNDLKNHPENAAKIKALLKSIKDRADAKCKKK
jgi:RHS repeat-associated protein